MRFKPYLGLTIFTLIATAILLTLGTWQYNRLQWKTQLLTDIDTAASSAPFESYGEIESAFKDGEPIDFRRVSVTGTYLANSEGNNAIEFHVFTAADKKSAWRLFQVMKTDDNRRVFVAGEVISDALKDIPRPVSGAPVTVSGYVRTYQKPSRFVAKSSPEANRWFSFNALKDSADWGKSLSLNAAVPTEFYIDAETQSDTPEASNLPIKKPDLPNNHFDYMLTWYSFALILWIIYAILHMRGGRLKFRH